MSGQLARWDRRWYRRTQAWSFILRRYLPRLALLSLSWELAHLPLYTIWATGQPAWIAFAVVHCTAGDVLIGTVALMLALILSRQASPRTGQCGESAPAPRCLPSPIPCGANASISPPAIGPTRSGCPFSPGWRSACRRCSSGWWRPWRHWGGRIGAILRPTRRHASAPLRSEGAPPIGASVAITAPPTGSPASG